jgi:hypothetical protein
MEFLHAELESMEPSFQSPITDKHVEFKEAEIKQKRPIFHSKQGALARPVRFSALRRGKTI